MRLTRKELAAMGIEEEKIELIVNAHMEALEGVKEERDKYKADAEKLPTVQKELDDLKKAGDKDPYKVKYEALKEEYEEYKAEEAKKETTAKKADAYRAMLKELGVAEKRLDAVLRVTDLEKIELDDKGALKGLDDLKKAAKEEWEDFIQKKQEKGTDTEKPPANKGGKTTMTKEEIMKISDRAERRKAMIENNDLFPALANIGKE